MHSLPPPIEIGFTYLSKLGWGIAGSDGPATYMTSTAYYTISPKCIKLFLIYYVIFLFFQILGRMASKPNLWCCPCSKKPEFKILLSHSQSRGRGHHGVPGTPFECLGGRPLINRSPILVIFWGKNISKPSSFVQM